MITDVPISLKKWFPALPLWLLLSFSAEANQCLSGLPCLVLTSCPDLLAILENPTPSSLKELREATCGFEGRVPKVCCTNLKRDVASETPVSDLSHVTPTPSPTPAPTAAHSSTSTVSESLNPIRTPRFNEDLLPKSCGISFSPRISRGKKVTLGSYPWMAVLGFRAPGEDPEASNLTWGCGGSLIHKRYVLTAAHCAIPRYNDNHTLSRVRLGEHNLKTEKDCWKSKAGTFCSLPPQEFGIEEVVLHHHFNRRAPESDDIALIRLDKDVEYNAYVHPICLPGEGRNAGDFVGDTEAIIAGWGIIKSGYSPKTLLATTVPHVPLERCQKNYRNLLVKEQVCFGGKNFKDSCSGDSGGPLFQVAHPGAPYTQLGIVSYGYKNCGTEGVGTIYTNVGSYKTWILQNLKP